MGEVHDQLEGLVAEGLEGEDNVIDQQIPVCFPDFVAAGDVVEHGMTGSRRAGLIENVQRLDRLEFILLVHIVL